jgi:hypothetical protein
VQKRATASAPIGKQDVPAADTIVL